MVDPGDPRSTRIEAEKRAAAEAAVAEVLDGMLVGLGTGSTAGFAISALARRARAGLAIETTATSLRTAALAEREGLVVRPFDELSEIDVCIDGVDEIDGDLRAIKGAGGALLREKIVARAAKRMIAICDSSKQVARLGTKALPVEFLPFARTWIGEQIIALGVRPVLRTGGSGEPDRTDQGNFLFDCILENAIDPIDFAVKLTSTPGIIGHGLFLTEIDALYVGHGDRVDVFERSAKP